MLCRQAWADVSDAGADDHAAVNNYVVAGSNHVALLSCSNHAVLLSGSNRVLAAVAGNVVDVAYLDGQPELEQ